jgi:outer membrane biosynthesis protein TonB
MNSEEKDKRIGYWVSGIIHVLVLILFIFILAWREPNPPLPEYGIELNFGLEEAGSGSEQPLNPAADNLEDEPQPEASTQSEEIENEITPEDEVEVEQPLEESTKETEPEPIEEIQTQEIESPDVIEEQQEINEPTERIEEVENPAETEAAAESDSDTEKEPTSDSGEAKEETPVMGGNSQGDQPDATGDQGDPRGSLDARALYGKPGGGDGASLSMTGWVWDNEPRPDDQSSEAGRIVFEIEVDDLGDLVSIQTIEKTVSPAVERIYRREVEKLTFSPTSDNPVPAPRSKGRITFIIRSR